MADIQSLPAGPLAPSTLDELGVILTRFDPRLRPDGCTRLIIGLAELQQPGSELRRIYLDIATLALMAAAKIPDPNQASPT